MSSITTPPIKVADNMELDFPARMSDGRQFTDYRQNCLLNNNLSQGKTSWLYRQDLINNRDQWHQQFMQEMNTNTKCNTCKDNTVLEVKNIQQCTPMGCSYTVNDPQGLGLGRKY